MSIRRLFYLAIVTLLTIAVQEVVAQDRGHVPSKERGDPRFRRKTNIDANLVRTTIFNFGLTGRTGVVPGEIPYEWPKNTNRHYIALTGIFIGAETKDESGEVIQIVDVPTFRSSPDGRTWNMEPVPEYLNENSKKIAISDDPSSWPPFWPDKLDDPVDPGWPGSWNGFFGKNIFNADQEMFFRTSDDRYDRYNFFPDTTDLSRRGLGLLVDFRVMEWSQILINDVVFILQDIKNDGTTDYQKAAFTLWLADLVGGDGDSQDDTPKFDLLLDIAWSLDRDGRGNQAFGRDPVGVAASAFLETPGNAVDGIDNDGDGEPGSPKITEAMIEGEDPTDQIDNNGNGLIDENMSHVPFNDQAGVGFRDRIDNNGDGEPGSPVVTDAMLQGEISGNARDDNGNYLYDEGTEDLGSIFADGIDNNDNGEADSPTVTQEMINVAASDRWRRYFVTDIRGDTVAVLVDLGAEDLGKRYADGIDNDGDGAIDEGIDEGIDEMIDESRDDGIDNDGDWNILQDDLGFDGVPETGDPGEGDGVPTSGAGTAFPGEPNIDKTDVSESDQIGLTNVQYLEAGAINFSTRPDRFFWDTMMIPGDFNILDVIGDFDLFVSSGLFPLKAGRRERISMAVILGENQDDAIRNKDVAQLTYDTDYQFAQAPVPPIVTAVPGDGKVTLYWDTRAEESFDRFLSRLGEPGFDFEGYRIYRSTDPAFRDPLRVTDANGIGVFMVPVAQFDKKDGITGLHPVDVNGAAFFLGNDTGLRHTWTDTSVINGLTYYYAVVSYDFGSVFANIPPSESPMSIKTIIGTTEVELGPNVVKVTPNPPVAGYVPATLGEVELIAGSTTGQITYDIVDPREIRDGHIYRITFEDTIKAGQQGQNDTLTTKNWSLFDVTDSGQIDTLVFRSTKLDPEDEQPIVDGFQLKLFNEDRVELDRNRSRWNRDGVHGFVFTPFRFLFLKGAPRPSDYRITIGDVGMGKSRELAIRFGPTLPAKDVNFRVENLSENREVEFAFWELDGNDGQLSANQQESDIIIFMEPNVEDSLVVTWQFKLAFDSTTANPASGDQVDIYLRKPFLSQDVFQFTAQGPKVDRELAKRDLDRVKVVPNPYVASAIWEPRNPFNTGRGPRSIHFTHLPKEATIHIYTVNGELVDVIEHKSTLDDGTAEWDLLTRDNLAVSYGIYIYHIEAPGIGEKVGRFAVIK
jgi:hypothetical protein